MDNVKFRFTLCKYLYGTMETKGVWINFLLLFDRM